LRPRRIAGIVTDEDPVALIGDPRRARRASASRSSTPAAMADSSIPPALAAELKERFSDPELVELTFLIGYINMLNLFNNCLDVRYNGEYALLKTPASPAPAPQAATG
jgi:hypothetical protein